MLDSFLQPERFHPLRVASVPDRFQQQAVVEILRRRSRPLQPIPTAETARLVPMADIRGVLFDVYGTMVISGSGDVGTADASGQVGESDPKVAAFEGAWRAAELTELPDYSSGPAELAAAIRRHHAESRGAGVDYPEVDIVAMWREVVERTLEQQELTGTATDQQLHILAAEYEAVVNPVWPMPGLLAALEELRQTGRILGIISNAQFFTPAVFPALLARSLDQLGFDRKLIFFSYQGGRAKPGSAMFEQAILALHEFGLSAENAIYVGNDMRNDIAPGAKRDCGPRCLLAISAAYD